MKKTVYLTALLITLGVLSLYGIGSYLTKPYPSRVDLKQVDLPIENITFKSQSGSLISGWYLQGKPHKGGILLMHGVKSNRLEMLQRARFLYLEGYSVLLFDFQGHGESGGKNITFGYLESLDAQAGYEFLENRLSNKSIGVIGVSLGGASALLSNVKRESKALILESVYPTLDEAIDNRLKLYLGDIGEYLTPFLTYQLKPRFGFEANDLKPIEHISKVSHPIFIIAGEKDQHTTLSQSKSLFDKANEIKKIWIIKDAGHIDFSKFKPIEYEEKVLEFFEKHL